MPLKTTHPDSTKWKPSEIPSRTQSVSAFLPGRVSVGPSSLGKVGREATRRKPTMKLDTRHTLQ